MKNKLHNPFYDNHLFTKDDMKRALFPKRDWLWLFPTFVQKSDEKYAFHYKIVNGRYYLIVGISMTSSPLSISSLPNGYLQLLKVRK